ncbi:hypothetical protein [Amycolatopsis sp. NPDC004079]|uniref:hypothetical protein n=1 Tax=Amycolatopsis sp. NPDC004079 TaxID=3154549 RepID=UPI0033A1E258
MPTSADVHARMRECIGRWAEVSNDRDPLTAQARALRDELIVNESASGASRKALSDQFGLSLDGVGRVVRRKIAARATAGSETWTSADVDARLRECTGHWGELSGTRDPLTLLARARRDELIGAMGAEGENVGVIARRFGLGRDAVIRVLQAVASSGAGSSSGQHEVTYAD